MRNIMLKEMKLSASPLAYFFILFGFMFMVPGYPVLCSAFFVTLGLFQSFQTAREANDIVFSSLLPIAKKDVVKGKYLFVLFIEACAFVFMVISTVIRMTLLCDSSVYRANAMMNANPFALGMALIIFGIFNWIFVGGFFKTAWKQGKPFIIHIIVTFVFIAIAEALHWIPAFKSLNAFGTEHFGLQTGMLLGGFVIFGIMTYISYRNSCRNFEIIDL
jgi:hypothetical protein